MAAQKGWLSDGSENCCDVWLEVSGAVVKTGVRAGGGRLGHGQVNETERFRLFVYVRRRRRVDKGCCR